MKPQKKLQVMQGGRLRPFFKGQILTYNERAEVYYFEHKGTTKRSPFTPEQLEAMHSSLVQPLSADGLLLSEFQQTYPKAMEKFIDGNWKDIELFESSHIQLYRLKPQPEYIDVPECIKLISYSDLQPAILNGNRQLFIHEEDGLPVMMEHGFNGEPHRISLTPPESLEDGQIYFSVGTEAGYLYKDQITMYSIYCNNENRMYFFDSSSAVALSYSNVEDSHIRHYRKVTKK